MRIVDICLSRDRSRIHFDLPWSISSGENYLRSWQGDKLKNRYDECYRFSHIPKFARRFSLGDSD
jgi:hypothetical protein